MHNSPIVVDLAQHSYPISIHSGILRGNFTQLMPAQASRFVVITDITVAALYGRTLFDQLEPLSCPTSMFTIPDGESSKSFDQYRTLLEQMLEEGTDRQSVVLALGGGVVGDLAGFVAATYMRGIRLVQIPTTLLAQVDSSVGGKVGINMPGAKNSVGAFWQPTAVFIDPSVLKTLDDANYTAGLAEVVKYGVILDSDFFAMLESNVDEINSRDTTILTSIICRCCELKAAVVQQDERETTGVRSILNYGHTFAHAIEGCFGYGEYLHGHAVGIGMTAAANLARLMGRVDDSFVARQTALLSRLKIPVQFPQGRHQEMLDSMRLDKKARGGQSRFVLPTRLGQVELVDCNDQAIILQAMSQSVK